MTEMNVITSYVLVRNGKVIRDGEVVFENAATNASDFLKSAYEALAINYPKFFKMDELCKVGFLAAESLLRAGQLGKYKAEEKGVLFSNANSSLSTDILYNESTKQMASPALFVYTLPNILIGELCIKNQIKGESACFVFDIFDPEFQTKYLNLLLDSGKIKVGVSGWADFYDEKYEALFYLVERKEGDNYFKNDSQIVSKIYQGTWNNSLQP